jgi:hypothetical protein
MGTIADSASREKRGRTRIGLGITTLMIFQLRNQSSRRFPDPYDVQSQREVPQACGSAAHNDAKIPSSAPIDPHNAAIGPIKSPWHAMGLKDAN